MGLARQEVRDVLGVYIRAWVEQDPGLIVTIFTENATYHERVLAEPIRDREGIREYWQKKVVESQRDITCELLNLYLDGNTAIAEWEALFQDVPQGVRKRMREVAILVFEGQLIASLREYWSSEQIPRLRAQPDRHLRGRARRSRARVPFRQFCAGRLRARPRAHRRRARRWGGDTLGGGRPDHRQQPALGRDDGSVNGLGEIAAGIHPAVLTHRGLAAALQALADRLPVPVHLDVTERRLPGPIEVSIYFFCSEALINVVKHAQASSAWVRVAPGRDRCTIEVRDDGIGGAEPRLETSGLTGLRDRIGALKGTMQISSPASAGTTLRAWIPLANAADAGRG